MSKYKTKGILNGIFAAISYGTNPLFALPMYSMGLEVNSVLFYRYFIAVIIYGIYLKFFKKISFRINFKEFISLLFLGIIFSFSSIFLFGSFKYIDSGIACTILFIYPVIVALISSIFFKEKLNKTTIFSILLTSVGICLLCKTPNGILNLKGILFVILSALSYAIYIICIKNLKLIKQIKYDKLSFYVMLFGLSVFIWNLKFCTQLQPIGSLKAFLCALALAIFPTIISLETINIAIRLIGATTTSVLGALEPLTAIFFGVLLFKELLTIKITFGIILILLGVILIILRKTLKS